ncbi:hypothetical protein [Streptomyces sp. NPDC002763]|uniref:hypothetical protein n=1 Tax=Streptomyces sp. NPDC002763 TaxID=3154427 RepID=UPI003328598E
MPRARGAIVAYLGGMELHTDGTRTTGTRYYTCGSARRSVPSSSQRTATSSTRCWVMASAS